MTFALMLCTLVAGTPAECDAVPLDTLAECRALLANQGSLADGAWHGTGSVRQRRFCAVRRPTWEEVR